MPTPLYDSLKALAQEHPTFLDMPGHHGRQIPGFECWPSCIDFTENGRTGDLLGGDGDQIEEAETLWARRLGVDSCLFLTGGSTQGIHSGLALLAGTEAEVAVDRGSHRSVFHALALLGLTPRYLSRPWLEEEGILGPISPQEVEDTLTRYPKVKVVCLTSPTYYGVISDLPAIAAVCRRHGVKLMVDGAHGAHLPLLGYTGFSAPDLTVVSAHKTLPAPGQTALLLAQGYSLHELRRVGAIYGTSSPSYVMMAALDALGAYWDGEGRQAYTTCAKIVEHLRSTLPALTPGKVELDPTRLVIHAGNGFALAQAMREANIYPEMADMGHVVCIFTCADGPEVAQRLVEAVKGIPAPLSHRRLPPPPPPPQMVLSPRRALFALWEEVAWEEAEGRVCAGQVAPYPPGIPVIAPGELVEKKHLAYLKEIGYNKGVIPVIHQATSET